MLRKCTVLFLSVVFMIVFLSGCVTKQKSVSGSQAIVSSGIFKDYDVLVVQNFTVPGHVAAPDTAGSQIAEKVVFQVRRYSQKYNLFNTVTQEGKTKIPAGSKVMIVKGEVSEYTMPSVGKRIGMSFLPGAEFSGTAAFGAQYKFIDKNSGKVLYDTSLRSTSTGSADTVDYAMERNAEAAAKVVYQNKTGN